MARFPLYAPQHRIQINGDDLPPAMNGSVVSISLTSGLEGADRVEIKFANLGLRWLDHPLLHTDNTLSLQLGYAPDPLEQVFAGEITGVGPTFPLNAIPEISVTAQDAMHRLMRNKKDESHRMSIPFVGNFPLPDIAIIPAVARDLRPEIDPVGGALSLLTMLASYLVAPEIAQEAVRIQEGVSDFEFLTKLAKDNGWDMTIDHAQQPFGLALRFKSLVEDFTPAMTLRYGATIKSFDPKLTNVGDVSGITARIWVDSLKTEFVLVLMWDFERSSFDFRLIAGGLDPISAILGPAAAGNTIDIKPSSFAMAVQQMFNELLPRLNKRHTGSASAVGDPHIRPGEIISIEGVGAQFGGLYRVTSATHQFDQSGYSTSFEVRKEAWFGALPLAAGAEGLTRALGQAFQ